MEYTILDFLQILHESENISVNVEKLPYPVEKRIKKFKQVFSLFLELRPFEKDALVVIESIDKCIATRNFLVHGFAHVDGENKVVIVKKYRPTPQNSWNIDTRNFYPEHFPEDSQGIERIRKNMIEFCKTTLCELDFK